MQKSDKKKVVGLGLYIVLAACLISALTINVVRSIKKNSGENIIAPVDTTLTDVPDERSQKTLTRAITKDPLRREVEEVTDDPGKKQKEPSQEDKDDGKSKNERSTYYAYVMPIENGEFGIYDMETPVFSKTLRDWRVHRGVDIPSELGTPVMVFASGTVQSVSDDAMYGKTVTVDHGDGVVSKYCNLAAVLPESVTVGAELDCGDVIGSVGDTAISECENEPHLHFEVFNNGESVDPTAYFSAEK